MKVLIACEESQTSCIAFRKLGHEAYSCDIQDCSGGHPEWHIKGDVTPLLRNDWDLIIAHPPCTYLTVTGNRWFGETWRSSFLPMFGDIIVADREKERDAGVSFFMKFTNLVCPHVAIENPIGCMSRIWRKPDQIIQPYQFGDPARKATCLWLKGLPKLIPTDIVKPDVYYYKAKDGSIKSDSKWRMHYKQGERQKVRSKTFQGIADAMSKQWSDFITNERSKLKNAGE